MQLCRMNPEEFEVTALLDRLGRPDHFNLQTFKQVIKERLTESPEKRPRLEIAATHEAEYYIEQRLVGWIIGKGGSTLREIEQAHDVKVVVDQSSKGSGFSKVLISGSKAKVLEAVEHINNSLSEPRWAGLCQFLPSC
eukprot:g21034.t1